MYCHWMYDGSPEPKWWRDWVDSFEEVANRESPFLARIRAEQTQLEADLCDLRDGRLAYVEVEWP